MATDTLLVLCTTTADSAAELAAGIVDARLAACVNIPPAVSSVYRWEGAVETANEALMLIKTTNEAYIGLENHIKQAHPYELPEIIAVSIETGSHDYLQWLARSTGKVEASNPNRR